MRRSATTARKSTTGKKGRAIKKPVKARPGKAAVFSILPGSSSVSPYKNPELMVIGDSLAQGVRSLSFRPDFATQCVGYRLAQLQGWSFSPQAHPRPVLFDVEEEVRQLNIFAPLFYRKLIDGLCARINANLEAWMQELVDSTKFVEVPPFDNVAVGGALITDLLTPCNEWRDYLRIFRDFKLTTDDVLKNNALSYLPGLFKAINYAYILNPARNPNWEKFSAADWLRERQPKRVIVTIGHNESLWDVGFQAVNRDVKIEDLRGLDKLASAIAEVDGDWISWDLLPKVSAVANLDPVSSSWSGSGPGMSDNYCNRYEPVLSTGGNVLTGAQMRRIDGSIQKTNVAFQAKVMSAFRAGNRADRVRFFDDYTFFQSVDFKNQPNPNPPAAQALRVGFPLDNWGQHIDNRYIYGDYRPIPGTPPQGHAVPEAKHIVAGGIQSLDGMHLTGVGYMLKAIALSRQKDLKLKAVSDSDLVLKQAFQDDRLTKDFPTEVNTLRLFLRALQKVVRTEPVPTRTVSRDEEHLYADAWLNIISSPMKKSEIRKVMNDHKTMGK